MSTKETPIRNTRGAGSPRRILQILDLLANQTRPLSVRQAAEDLDFTPSTLHRLLKIMEEAGFLKRDPAHRTYSVGPELYRVAARIYERWDPLILAEDVLREAAQTYHETVLLGALLPEAGKLSFVGRENGDRKLLYHIDMNVPLSLVWGASGRAVLAHLPEEEIQRILESESASPAQGEPPPSLADLNAALAVGREQGYFVSLGQKLPGACGIAAPVFDTTGVFGSLTLTFPLSDRDTKDVPEIGRHIATLARKLSTRMGAEP